MGLGIVSLFSIKHHAIPSEGARVHDHDHASPHPDAPDYHDAHAAWSFDGSTFWELALETAPALLIAYVLAGLLRSFLRPAATSWLGRGSRLTQGLKGVTFGLPLPICSCGVLPLYETLIRRGVPPTAAMAFLIATPELGLDALLISIPLLGQELTIARLIAAALVALLAAWFIGRFTDHRRMEPRTDEAHGDVLPLGARIRAGLEYGLIELVDHTLPWILVGLGIATFAEPLLGAASLSDYASAWQVPVFALIGIPMYVCASGATPLAAIAIYNGVSPGAALAFLLTGPATNATTFGILTQLHGKRTALSFGLVVGGLAIACGWFVDSILGTETQTLVEAPAHAPPVIQSISLGILGILFVSSLYRQGARGMVDQILNPIH